MTESEERRLLEKIKLEIQVCGEGTPLTFRESIWLREIDALLAQPERAAVPVAWIEHQKGGDNLVWEQTNISCTPLYAASPINEEQRK